MLIVSKIKAIIVVVLLCLLWLLWPVYQSMAHKGKVAFPPFYQYIDLPSDNPSTQSIDNTAYKNVADKALNIISQHKLKINAPAISAAVAINGKRVWAGASGWADLESKIPVSTHTQFRIGSTSKALTGTALARLVDAKLIAIDSPISNYMNELPNPHWANITSRQLASHTAGLSHYKENTDYIGLYQTLSLSTRYEKVKDALSVFDSSELLFKPGALFSYSSFGVVLLSAVMEDAVGIPYLDIMQQQVFDPVGMSETMAEFQNKDRSNLATFYWNDEGRSKQVRKWRQVDLSHRLAGGGFISTSSDLVKMGMAFLQDDFISAETRHMFWTPQVLPNGDETPDGYALGWRVLSQEFDKEIGPITFANHGGVSRGAQSWLMVIPKYNMAVAININSNTEVFWDFAKVSMQLANIFILENRTRQQ
jgi:serine beta-lactamase-like protein LACTB, mitochondrial